MAIQPSLASYVQKGGHKTFNKKFMAFRVRNKYYWHYNKKTQIVNIVHERWEPNVCVKMAINPLI